ncbi:replicative helicase loader/inhibitor [Thermoanaerobacterium thermosaccharolyticum]|uniref:replicative helicase loader/inhibitor n=1 Tax=Thermoanaerobacterium thermosaccharolyticum TaxID=1517 RepID=UPI003DA8AB3F
MTVQETTKIVNALKIAYPRYAEQIQENKQGMISLFAFMFKDVPYKVVNCALQKFILESPYPPTVHDLYKEIVSVTKFNVPDEDEAWHEVARAIRLYGYYRPEEAFDSMSEVVRDVVKAIGWSEICLSKNIDLVRDQFVRLYVIAKQRKEQEMLMPSILKRRIEKLAECKIVDISDALGGAVNGK